MTVIGSAGIDPLGSLIGLNGKLHYDPWVLNSDGSVKIPADFYGAFSVTTGDLQQLASLGINVAGTALLRFNTSGADEPVTLQPPGQASPATYTVPAKSFSLMVNGTANIERDGNNWFVLTGELDAFFTFTTDGLGVAHPKLQMDFYGTLYAGPSQMSNFGLNSTGYFQIDDTGIAADLTASLITSKALTDAGVSLGNNSLELKLNTTKTNINYTIPTLTVPGQPSCGRSEHQCIDSGDTARRNGACTLSGARWALATW